MHRLTRLHGILFTLASGNPGATRAVAPPQQQNTPYSIEMERILGKDLMALLSAGIMGDVLLLKLMVTNIFCVSCLAAAVASGGSKEATARASEGLVHGIRLCFSIVNCVVHFLLKELENDPHTNLRLLSPVSVFSDLFRCDEKFFQVLEFVNHHHHPDEQLQQ